MYGKCKIFSKIFVLHAFKSDDELWNDLSKHPLVHLYRRVFDIDFAFASDKKNFYVCVFVCIQCSFSVFWE